VNVKNINDRSSITESIENNLFDHIASICMLNRKAKYTRKSHWMELLTGIQHPLCNGIIDPKLDKDRIDENIKEAMYPFQKLIPMLWWIGPSARPADLSSILTDHGFVESESVLGMATELTAINETATPKGLLINNAVTPEEVNDWKMVFATVFELPPDACAFFSEPFALMSKQMKDRFLLLTGYLDGKPVACATFFISAGVGGIYNVGTLREARGKGIGYAITSAGMSWIKNTGHNVAILHSSSMGFNVYKRLGFSHLCDFHLFTNVD